MDGKVICSLSICCSFEREIWNEISQKICLRCGFDDEISNIYKFHSGGVVGKVSNIETKIWPSLKVEILTKNIEKKLTWNVLVLIVNVPLEKFNCDLLYVQTLEK